MHCAVGCYAAVFMIWLSSVVSPAAAFGNPDSVPEPNPPRREQAAQMATTHPMVSRAALPTVEWEFHKTSDNRHPDGHEQQLMWLMNRARSNPTVEGIWLAAIYDQYFAYLPGCSQVTEDIDFCYIAGALDHWEVDLDLLQNEFAGYGAQAPAAFDVRLYQAARAHSNYLIRIDGQNHTDQFDRIDDQNFSYTRARGNVFSYSLSAVYAHAAFNVDWGTAGGDGSGMQSPRGHRFAIMSLDGSYTNVGIAAVAESDSATSVGPLVVTGNYCEANTSAASHYNRFLVGTVWTDKDDDDLYDPGEGIGGVTVKPDQGVYYAVTSSAGGYALPITEPGTYEITFSGPALNSDLNSALSGDVVKTVRIGDDSVLLDLVAESDSTSPSDDTVNEKSGGGGGGCFIAALPAACCATSRLWPVSITGVGRQWALPV